MDQVINWIVGENTQNIKKNYDTNNILFVFKRMLFTKLFLLLTLSLFG